jgi:membrane-bound metal-dependent hydrolase YbcI (DUF457 family)
MPGYKTHVIGGAAAVGGLAWLVQWLDLARFSAPALAVLAGAGVMGSLAPDVDTDSRGQNLFYPALILADLALILTGHLQWAAALGLAGMLPAVGSHRGWTHTWWAALLLPLPAFLLCLPTPGLAPETVTPFYLAAVAGYCSHLALDQVIKG